MAELSAVIPQLRGERGGDGGLCLSGVMGTLATARTVREC